jgi:hypothetical protein
VKTGRRSTSPGAVLKASPGGFRKLGAEGLATPRRPVEAISAVRSLMSFRATTPQTDEPTAAMYGELEALMGSALPSVDVLELPAPALEVAGRSAVTALALGT